MNKTYFSKNVNVMKLYESCSRIRVGEGSPKEEHLEKNKITFKRNTGELDPPGDDE